MRPHGPESSYIRDIDRGPMPGGSRPEGEKRKDLGMEAEDVVIDFFQSQFPGLDVRPATQDEDRGHTGIDSGKQIDAVLYKDGKPETGIQITTATDSAVRLKKMSQFRAKPFVRLEEMNSQDTSIPKALVFVEAMEIKAFLLDHNWEVHPKLRRQILDSMENSLKFALSQTKNPKEQTKVRELLSLVNAQKMDLESRKSPGTMH